MGVPAALDLSSDLRVRRSVRVMTTEYRDCSRASCKSRIIAVSSSSDGVLPTLCTDVCDRQSRILTATDRTIPVAE